ncbi:transketolase [Stenotrophobium rhamnosiphilum]|uniref:Transketolase n=1 Tax=Stenotrophobium rhamnosiphilum TaxID=2029166 RepID=A0A2T5MGF8_9GAMM|nr:transketolase [Stenotrophobium rhamnosiphilum]PTU31668.1 transketolase [Stenotrophobium rhamnosiphilum]
MHTRTDLANAIRALSMDAVQKANSGHPGMPLGMADIAEVLWNDFLSHNPTDPTWANRDRFVVSNGHGSMLVYSLLNLSGYDLPMEELKNFRQLHSKTAGHPEYGITPGVETTTGPLGQGIANGVGMAIAERVLAAKFNRDGLNIVDHYTYVFTGDGCLMEGISHEACSLAGTLGLNKLVVLYDDNNISIDGEVHGWFRDNTPDRFESYGWQVVRNVDGHKAKDIKAAIETARVSKDKPTLICCKTVIGFGSPNKQGKESSHGAPLGDAEIALARAQLNWPHAPFEIPADIRKGWDAREKGKAAQQAWNNVFKSYAAKYPEDATEFTRRMKGELPADWADTAKAMIAEAAAADKPVATRKSSKFALDAIAAKLPELFGGSADLTESNCTDFKGYKVIKPGDFSGNYISYGVREFGMSAAINGIVLHGGLLPFGGTFLTFSDYARNALRMAALMKIGSIFVYTHDSIGLGEDGPTHQSVEHISSLRLIPNLQTWRPADQFESAIAWACAIERRNGPTAFALSRQNLNPQPHPQAHFENARRGGYVLLEPATAPKAIIIATGSEVQLAVDAAKKLIEAGTAVRVVSMPCAELFLQQDAAYRDSVLPKGSKRLAVEAGVSIYWRGFVGDNGDVLGVDTYGESAPASAVFKHFGFTVDNVIAKVNALIG